MVTIYKNISWKLESTNPKNEVEPCASNKGKKTRWIHDNPPYTWVLISKGLEPGPGGPRFRIRNLLNIWNWNRNTKLWLDEKKKNYTKNRNL